MKLNCHHTFRNWWLKLNNLSYKFNPFTGTLDLVNSSGLTKLPATGAVNGSNVTYTFTQVPTFIVADDGWFEKLDSNGGVQWSSSGLTITMVNPPAYSIFGIA